MDGARKLFFLDQQIGDQKAAEHEEKINAQVAMPEKKIDRCIELRVRIIQVTQYRLVRMKQENDEK